MLSAQNHVPWSSDGTTELPGIGNRRLAEHRLPPPQDGTQKVAITAEVTASRGEVYVYAYGSTPRNKFLGYRQSERIQVATDTTLTLQLTGLASTEMDSIVVGVAFYGEGMAAVEPPEITVTPSLAEVDLYPGMETYLNSFFGYAREHALDRDSMNWPMLEQDARALAARSDSMPEVHDALNFTLRRIDRHSYLQDPPQYESWTKGNNDEDAIDPNLVYPTGRRVDDRMVYLTVPGVASGHEKTLNAYADSLRNLIAQLDGPDVEEWIVDLRENTGGNCWPMLAGVGPILGEGVCGYFMRRDGSQARPWAYREGGSYLDGKLFHSVTPYELQNPARVAVLQGPKTASSAEVVAIAFRGRADTRSFGQPTGGYSTGNQIFKLSDGAAMVLTTSVYADREKTPFGAEVTPDEEVKAVPGVDAASEAAAAWLRAGR